MGMATTKTAAKKEAAKAALAAATVRMNETTEAYRADRSPSNLEAMNLAYDAFAAASAKALF